MDGVLFSVVLTAHILVGVGVIGLVLLQHGKGADMGAAFGSGASGSLFGATGAANFLSRATAVLAAVFFLTSLSLSYMATGRTMGPASVMEESAPVKAPAPVEKKDGAPAVPEAADSKAREIPK